MTKTDFGRVETRLRLPKVRTWLQSVFKPKSSIQLLVKAWECFAARETPQSLHTGS
jgi:hypothetical protein